MRAFASLLLASAACLPNAPSLDEHETSTEPGATPGWPDLGTPSAGEPPVEPPPAETGSPPDPGAPHPKLWLTEVHADPTGTDGAAGAPEFVELANLGQEPAPLDGLQLRARSWPLLDAESLGLQGHALEPGALLVVERFAQAADAPASPLLTEWGLRAAFSGGSGLRNGDGGLALGAPADPVDVFVYGAPQTEPWAAAWEGPPGPAPESGVSLCRRATHVEVVDASAWTSCAPSPGTWPPEEPGAQGDTDTDTDADTETSGGELPALVVSEVFANPPGPSAEEKTLEYVEVLNASEEPVDLVGWLVADALEADAPGTDPLTWHSGDGGCEPAGCLAPDTRALIVGQAWVGEANGALVLEVDDSTIAEGGLTLSEPVVLRNPEGVWVSSYRDWPDPGAQPLPADGESLERVAADAVDAPRSWITGAPTPGQ